MNHSQRVKLFERLRAEHLGLLTAILWKLMGDKELFAEALQFALLAMWQSIEKLDDPRAAGYIYRIALSANSKAWRSRIGKDGELPRAAASASQLADDESLTIIRRTIARLPEQQAAAVTMRYFDENSYQAIAQKLQCSEETARSHVSKGLATLRAQLAGVLEQE